MTRESSKKENSHTFLYLKQVHPPAMLKNKSDVTIQICRIKWPSLSLRLFFYCI